MLPYETNRRKVEEKSQILASELPASEWAGSSVHWTICAHDACLCLVVHFEILGSSN